MPHLFVCQRDAGSIRWVNSAVAVDGVLRAYARGHFFAALGCEAGRGAFGVFGFALVERLRFTTFLSVVRLPVAALSPLVARRPPREARIRFPLAATSLVASTVPSGFTIHGKPSCAYRDVPFGLRFGGGLPSPNM